MEQKYLVFGATAGGLIKFNVAISRTCTAPLDRIKIHLQTHCFSLMGIKNIIQVLYKEGGIRSFWRGNLINCCKIVPETGIKFFVFENMKVALNAEKEVLRVGFCAGFSGFVAQLMVYPIETIKIRIMATNSSFIQVIGMLKNINLLFRGLTPSLIGIVPYAGLELSIYNRLRHHNLLLVGSLASGTAATVVYPLSLIRTRLQAQGTKSHPQVYSGFWDVAQQTLKKEGVLGFYRGLLPTLFKVVPSAAITYFCYETAKNNF